MIRAPSLLFVASSIGLSMQARAEQPSTTSAPAPPPPAGPTARSPAPPPGAISRSEWLVEYDRARDRMRAGAFGEAAQMFGALATTAPGATEYAVAIENQTICADWAARDLVFVRRADLGESTLSAKAVGERTTDEIAVLYTNGVFYGIGAGAWLAVQTEPNTIAGGVLPALALAGGAVGGIALADYSSPFRYGVPQSIVSGMYIGLEEGIVWSFWNQARTYRRDEWEAKTVATVIWGMATAGAVAGGVIGTMQGTTPGRASFVGSTALWAGTTTGLAAAALTTDPDVRDDNALLAAAIGLNAGAIGGAFAAGPVSPSIARVRCLDLGAIGGILLFGGLYLAAADKKSDERGFMGVTSLGAAAGLGVAWAVTSKMPPDRSVPGRTQDASPFLRTMQPTLSLLPAGVTFGLRGEL